MAVVRILNKRTTDNRNRRIARRNGTTCS